jgi:hypothetical protein
MKKKFTGLNAFTSSLVKSSEAGAETRLKKNSLYIRSAFD